jgi:hypothetical protein
MYENVTAKEFAVYKKSYGLNCGPTCMIDSTHMMYGKDGIPVGLINFDDIECTKNPQYKLSIDRDKTKIIPYWAVLACFSVER